MSSSQAKDDLIGSFSAADIMLGHCRAMSGRLGLIGDQMPRLAAYVAWLERTPGRGRGDGHVAGP